MLGFKIYNKSFTSARCAYRLLQFNVTTDKDIRSRGIWAISDFFGGYLVDQSF
jgi:hypothetical protein